MFFVSNLTISFLKDWIPGQTTPPDRNRSVEDPGLPGMTQYIVLIGSVSGHLKPPSSLCLFTFQYIRANPVDPVVRVLFLYQ